CVLLSMTQSQGWVIAWTHQNWALPLCVIGYIVLIHIAETTRLSPLIVGKTVKLHPIISVAGLIAGADLFGIVGALFAAPFLGVLQTIVISLWKEWRNKYPEHFLARNEVAETEAFVVSTASETSMETTSPPEPFMA
ncbi:MAG TPA: AI-2E family transporter, partial [Ktedonosporobacter sp.]|nr:AI-2E family transporter [Ktedonosporobacter sp.]